MIFLSALCVFILASVIIAASVRFLHWNLGSPSAEGVVPGRIFSSLGMMIHVGYYRHEEREDERIAREIERLHEERPAGDERDFKRLENRIRNSRRLNWYKPLGMCIYCFSVWFTWAVVVGLYLTPFMPTTTHGGIEFASHLLFMPGTVFAWLIYVFKK